MGQLHIDIITERILQAVKTHEIKAGAYARWTKKYPHGELRANPYGCADAANILYSMFEFPKAHAEQEAFIAALQEMQNPQTGLFSEGLPPKESHHDYHTTAHCIGALELFNALPQYPLYGLQQYLDFSVFEKMMNEMDWLHNGKAAHLGAGIYAALVLTGEADSRWRRRYFDFFNATCNPNTGVWATEPTTESYTPRFHIGDSFHYLFNYAHFHEPIPYPEALIDFCLKQYHENHFEEAFGNQFHFIEMDWVYCLNRASRQTAHRYDEVKSTLATFARKYIDNLIAMDWSQQPGGDDLHLLFGVTCCLTELQNALPGVISSSRPMRLVLDRRPFI